MCDLLQNAQPLIIVGTVRCIAFTYLLAYVYLLAAGHLIKNWKNRWFLLKGDMLFYFRSEEDLSPLGAIPLRGAKVTRDTSHEGMQYCLRIMLASATLQPFYLQAANEQDFRDWFDVC
jgi:hypothetical protein